MKPYSTKIEIREFLDRIGPRGLFVHDLDGNVLEGFKVTEGREIPLGPTDNPKNQSMPFGLSRAQIESYVADGTLTKQIFAGKTMDVRLPQRLVDFVNETNNADEPFKIAFLTSRSEAEAKKILSESGVRNVDKVTLVADSGAILNIQETQILLRPLTEEEDLYKRGLEHIAKTVQAQVDDIVVRHMGPAAELRELYVEHKGIASNIHWRGILDANGQGDESPLDHDIGALLRSKVIDYTALSPEEDGKKIFKTLDGPATVELKIASVNKGIGLAILMARAAEYHTPPTAFVFSGDDYSKGNGHPGTDYFAAVQTDPISVRHGIPGYNVLTLHPKGSDINGMEPEFSRMVDTLGPEYEKPPVHLIVRTPEENGRLVLHAYGRDFLPPENNASVSVRTDRSPALVNI